MEHRKFWSLWMVVLGLVVVIAGVSLAVVVPFLLPAVQDLFYRTFSGGTIGQLAWADRRHIDWLYGVLGGTLAGWGVLLALLARRTLTEDRPWIWDTLLASVLTWFALDTALSLYYFVVPNVVLNTVVLVLALVPMVQERHSRVRDPRGLVRDFFERVYNRRELEFVPSAFSPDYFEHRPSGARTSAEAVAILRSAFETFPDLRAQVADLVVEGDLVAARVTFTGTPVRPYAGVPPVPRLLTWEAMEFFRVAGGRVTESWGSWPNHDIVDQMAADPASVQASMGC